MLCLVPAVLVAGFACAPAKHEPTAAGRLACERFKEMLDRTPTKGEVEREDPAAFDRYAQAAQAAREALLRADDKRLKEVREFMDRPTAEKEQGGLLAGAEGVAKVGEACERAGVPLF
jgi:hypothetical protein